MKLGPVSVGVAAELRFHVPSTVDVEGGMVLRVISDKRWAVLEPLINEVRRWAARPIEHLRRTIEAIVWRHDNGAKWRSLPSDLGPWWMAAQTFIRWSRLGVWERLLRLVQERCGLELGMARQRR
jgi:transposase